MSNETNPVTDTPETETEEIPEALKTFYGEMEKWIGDDMLTKIFEQNELVVDIEEYLALLFGQTSSGPMSNNDKIKKIFDNFRKESTESGQHGGSSLEEFKNYIKQKIKEIKVKN